MHKSAKIATCCYCGTRAALTLRGQERHELACSSCGAPLHEMKMLKAAAPERPARHKAYPSDRPVKDKRKKKKKKKSFAHRAFEELWDIAEDIFD
ncbi:MAG: hypothetical protein OIF48_09535 [Silicimonas sp.]|nr:hypothetical protein [Silicimonas sp.]